MNESARVKLTLPLKIGEKIVTAVNIRRPKVRDLRALEKALEPGMNQMDQSIAMAAALCDIPAEAMDDMDATDFAAISEVITRFLPSGSKGGEAS